MRLGPCLTALFFAVVPAVPTALLAADFFVPSLATPTLQAAIAAAGGTIDLENTIYLGTSPSVGNYTLGGLFDSDHHLTIRPDNGAGYRRATIVGAVNNAPVIVMTGAPGSDQGYVTLQDLDILHHGSGCAADVVSVIGYSNTTIERCRIGLNWTTPGPDGWVNLRIQYPTEIVVRNCIMFSLCPAQFDHGIYVFNMPEPTSSVFLYNNLVADYQFSGIRVNPVGGILGGLVVLRNNVAVNSTVVAPEPRGYRSEVCAPVEVATSHNFVYATAGFGESIACGISIANAGDGTFGGLPRAAAPPSFMSIMWAFAPPYDANPVFFRLVGGGPLHDGAADYGQDLPVDGAPHPRDIAVVLDIDREGRPGGLPEHTDRGPDQLEPNILTGVDVVTPGRGDLRAAPEQNPAHGVRVRFSTKQAGMLSFEIFDLAGRRIHRELRNVSANDAGVLEWNTPSQTGLMLYRIRLEGSESSEARGKILVLR